jgi:hypothetical protein
MDFPTFGMVCRPLSPGPRCPRGIPRSTWRPSRRTGTGTGPRPSPEVPRTLWRRASTCSFARGIDPILGTSTDRPSPRPRPQSTGRPLGREPPMTDIWTRRGREAPVRVLRPADSPGPRVQDQLQDSEADPFSPASELEPTPPLVLVRWRDAWFDPEQLGSEDTWARSPSSSGNVPVSSTLRTFSAIDFPTFGIARIPASSRSRSSSGNPPIARAAFS